jgi:hypothetical protein
MLTLYDSTQGVVNLRSVSAQAVTSLLIVAISTPGSPFLGHKPEAPALEGGRIFAKVLLISVNSICAKYHLIHDLTARAELQSAHPGLTRFG